jgi:hypothetical protein
MCNPGRARQFTMHYRTKEKLVRVGRVKKTLDLLRSNTIGTSITRTNSFSVFMRSSFPRVVGTVFLNFFP